MNIKNFVTLVQEQASAIQSKANLLLDFNVGSILRACVEAYAAVAMWLQTLIVEVLNLTRASTSSGADLDSWLADYGFMRAGAVFATGSVKFGRYTATNAALIPVGSMVQNADGSKKYVVVIDTANANYTVNGYLIAESTIEIAVPVQAVASGTFGNIDAGSINTLGQAMSGIDYCSNIAMLTNGVDSESDVSARKSFVGYIQSLSKATLSAIQYAISTVRQGIEFTITENADYAGNVKPGYFYAVVDDGTGAASSELQASAYTAINSTRALGVNFSVFSTVPTVANVTVTITAANHATAAALANTAIVNFISGLGINNTLYITKLYQAIYASTPDIINVSALQVNGSAADIAADNKHTIIIGTVTIS